MITLKEYEIYLKVKKFIETENCDENYIIPKLINGIGIIPAYVPLIIESDDMEPTKYYSLSTAARGCGILNPSFSKPFRTHTFYQGGSSRPPPQLSQKPFPP